jgi:hypothetical protein
LAAHDLALQTRLDSLDTSLSQCLESQLLSTDNLKAAVREVRDQCSESVRSLQEDVTSIKQMVSMTSLRKGNNTFQYSLTGGDLEREEEEVKQEEVPPQTTQEVTMDLTQDEET